MPNIRIDEYISNFNTNVKSNMFEVNIQWPGDVLSEDVKFNVKSVNIPQSDIDGTSTYWFGREYKMTSSRKFEDITLTLYAGKEAFIIEKLFEWHELCYNTFDNNYGVPREYMKRMEITLINIETGTSVMQYILHDVWPKVIEHKQLDYGEDGFLTVDVAFAIQNMEIKHIPYV